MSKDLELLVESFYKVIGRLSKARNALMSFNDTEPLNTAAIHFIDVVGKHPDYNASQIAEVLGNTNGAITQMAAKLEKKGFIKKKKNNGNDKEVLFVLTDNGKLAYDGHEKLHRELYGKLDDILKDFSASDVEKIKTALAAIDACIDEYWHM